MLNGVQAGETDRYVLFEPSGEVLRLVMEEPLVSKDLVQVGADGNVPVSFIRLDAL